MSQLPRPRISVVSAAYNEEENLPVLYRRVADTLDKLGEPWELLIVDDHSSDGTFDVVRSLARQDPRVRGLRLARNRGSHRAKICGLLHARGECGIGMASDLQDPPELIPALFAEWEKGFQVVWAARASRPGESASTRLFSYLYRTLFGRVLGVTEIETGSSSFMLLDRRVMRSFQEFRESEPHYLALIAWMGFRSTEVPFEQGARLHGKSGWTLRMKLNLVLNSVLGFSPAPLRLIGALGWLITAAAAIDGLYLTAFASAPLPDWRPVTTAVFLVGGIQLIAIAWIGEYLWRTLEETRRRPLYLIEDSVGDSDPDASV